MIDYPAFAYSANMQLILFLATCINVSINYLCLTDVIAMVYGQTVSYRRKILFALVVGLVLNHLWIYGIFALLSFKKFSILLYSLIVTPNPVFAILYYWLGISLLGLSKYRSVHLMRIVYIYILMLTCLGEMITVLMRTHLSTDNPAYNYLLDLLASVTYTAIYLLLYALIRYLIRRFKFQVQLYDSLPIKRLRHELALSFVYGSIIYLICTLVPWYLDTRFSMRVIAYSLGTTFLLLLMIFTTLVQYNRTAKQALDNKNINMAVLMNAINDFSGLKHDFFNILQTYEGYISIGDLKNLERYHNTLHKSIMNAGEKLDIANQISQNPDIEDLLAQTPQFVALVTEKQQKALEANVKVKLKILCDIKDFYIPNDELCFITAILWDMVISISQKETSAVFSMEQIAKDTKLLIINVNNTNGPLARSNFDKISEDKSIRKVRSVLNQYNNTFFHITHDNNNLSIYVELIRG